MNKAGVVANRARCVLGDLDATDRGLAIGRIASRIVLHLLAFMQTADAGAFQCGGVDVDILVAVVRANEAKAFLIIVKFYRTRIHRLFFSLMLHPCDWRAAFRGHLPGLIDRIWRVAETCARR